MRLAALVTGLPRESGLARERGLWWSEGHELAASTLEVAHEQLRVALAVGGVKRGRLPKPLHVPRPGLVRPAGGSNPARPSSSPQRRTAASVADVVAVLEATHRRVGS